MSNILFYNVGFTKQVIDKNPESISEFLNPDYKQLFDFYDKHKMNMNVVYDRTGNTPHYLKIKPDLLKIPTVDSTFNKSFRQCVEERTKHLLSLGKRINVVWSGGIDSTLVLFAFLHYCNDPSQITVYGTYSSVLESGSLFDKVILPSGVHHKIKVSSRRDFDDCPEDEIFVTGFFGNQLFGPTDNFTTNKTVKTDISFFHHQFNGTDPLDDYTKYIDPELHEFLTPCIKASPKPIETLRDLRWWFIFNLDWYTAEFATRINTKQQDNQYHFFNTDDFQRYVITTKEPFTKEVGNPLTHRWVMRELIEEWSGDSHYAWNKPKGVSNLGNPNPTWLFLLDDYSVYYLRNNSLFSSSRNLP
jgi:hypothetical protein